MDIGLIDVDGHHFPNLALMKISAWHKSKGDHVEMCFPFQHYDRIYQSKVFDDTYSQDIDYFPNSDEIVKGGTGYGLENVLPEEIEHIMPDYELYSISDTAYGFLTRGCPRHCPFCIVGDKEGLTSRKVSDLSEFWNDQKYIKLLDPNLLACSDRIDLLKQLRDSNAYIDFTQGLDIRFMDRESAEIINNIKVKDIHFAWDNANNDLTDKFARYAEITTHKVHGAYGTVYVLTNYHSDMHENLYRIYTLRNLGYDPYVMIYDKPHAPREIKRLQRWCNNRIIFKSCRDFKDYK